MDNWDPTFNFLFQIIAVLGFFSTLIVSGCLVYVHLLYFIEPEFQSLICRIILYLPVFVTQAFLSFEFPGVAFILEALRECYGAYALFSFMSLLIKCLGEEEAVVAIFESKYQVRYPFVPLTWMKPLKCDRDVVTHCTIRIIMIFLKYEVNAATSYLKKQETLLVSSAWSRSVRHYQAMHCAFDIYKAGRITLSSGYLYLCIINYVSTGMAMYTLIIFYLVTSHKLRHLRPLLKLFCIKAGLFFSFWQSVTLAMLFSSPSTYSEIQDVRPLAFVLQDWLICLEMPILACLHWLAFPLDEITKISSSTRKKRREASSLFIDRLTKVLSVEDTLSDAQNSILNDPPKKDFHLKSVNPTLQQSSSGGRDIDVEERASWEDLHPFLKKREGLEEKEVEPLIPYYYHP